MIALAGNADLHAKTYTWQGGARGGGGADQTNLFKAANWSPSGFSAQNSDLIFTNVNTSSSSILDVSASATLNSITFSAGALSFTLTNSTSLLTLNGGNNITVNSTNLQTLAVGIVLAGNSVWTTGTGSRLVVSGVISDGISTSYGITKTGNGTLRLNAANTFNGGINLSGGSLIIGNRQALGVPGSGGNAGVNFTGSGTLSAGIDSLSISNAITIGTNNATLDAAGNSWTLFGPISGSTGGLIARSSTGMGTLTLAGLNSYMGETILQQLTLALSKGALLGGTSGIRVSAGSSLLPGGNNQINPKSQLTLEGGKLSMAAIGSPNRAPVQEFASLTLTADSVIDFGALAGTSTLTFGSIAGLGTYSLSVHNWNGTTLWGTTSATGGAFQYTSLQDQTATKLSLGELANISFYSGVGTGFLGTGGIVGNEIIPIPEPSIVIASIMLLGFLLHSHMVKRQGLQQLKVVKRSGTFHFVPSALSPRRRVSPLPVRRGR